MHACVCVCVCVCVCTGRLVVFASAGRRYYANSPVLTEIGVGFVFIMAGVPIMLLDPVCEKRKGQMSVRRLHATMRV